MGGARGWQWLSVSVPEVRRTLKPGTRSSHIRPGTAEPLRTAALGPRIGVGDGFERMQQPRARR